MNAEAKLHEHAKSIVQRLTLEEKVGQLIHVGISGKKIDQLIEEDVSKRKIGGVILFARNIGNKAELIQLTSSLQTLSKNANIPPLFISADQEGGRVVRVTDGATQFPGAMALGQTEDESLAEHAGFFTGYEMAQLGIPLVFSPVLDVNNNPLNPVINTRSFGSDPQRVASIGVAFARGLRTSGAVDVIKHFPGHGDTQVDSHLDLPKIDKDVATLEKVELIPFRKAIQDGAEGVMSTHILFPKIDSSGPGTLSRKILTDLLRNQLQFKGLVFTDAMEMMAIAKYTPRKDAAKKAFQAGADVILLTSSGKITQEMYDSLLEGFQTKELSMEQLDKSVERQIYLKLKKNLFSDEEWTKRLLEKVNSEQQANPSGPATQVGENDTIVSDIRDYKNQSQASIEKTSADLNALYTPDALSAKISDQSIRSLRKSFPALSAEEKSRIRVYYISEALRKEAMSLGIPSNRIVKAGVLSPGVADQVVVLEFDEYQIGRWNALSDLFAKRKFKFIGLYTGNPFLRIRIPSNAFVLASFSTTNHSREALLNRLYSGEVSEAELVLRKP